MIPKRTLGITVTGGVKRVATSSSKIILEGRENATLMNGIKEYTGFLEKVYRPLSNLNMRTHAMESHEASTRSYTQL